MYHKYVLVDALQQSYSLDTISSMSDSFHIQGGNLLRGEINVQGSKNAATKLIAATLLTNKKCKLTNIPQLKDVEVMLEILKEMGSIVEYGKTKNTVYITNKDTDIEKLNFSKIKKLRSSIVFTGPLLARFGKVKMPYPGGDKIGKRSLDTHFHAFRDLGCKVIARDDSYTIIAPKEKNNTPKKIILDEFSVTATENAMMYAASLPIKVEISIAAQEPHIQNLAEFLRRMGAKVQMLFGHKIKIEGAKNLKGANIRVVDDYIEAGTFVIAGLVVGGDILIHNFPVNHLDLFLKKLKRAGANIIIEGNKTVRVKTSRRFSYSKIQTMIYPGIPTDLQSPLGVLATQCEGKTLIHDPLYEGRLEYLKELQKMGADITILDPHRAEVRGPSLLKGFEISGKDIRGGMSLIIAGLVAEGDTVLKNSYQVDRGYEKIDERLRVLGAKIRRV
ncbi:MAG: UDP-N-acetylglucosamine 1-carboxyvinyltransferase [Candidatus Spechtbacterales bacterium]|nr:UDP-N-acetylglucosamine 1-carboxyvinyltransferase [Candidatus Spechtbacterales bacterium]